MIDVSHCVGIVTHANCADGIASAMILHYAYPELPVRFAQYGAASLLELEVAPWLFCDITPDRERAQAFADAGAVVLDHHAHAADIVALFGTHGVYADDPGVSGAVLAFRQARAKLPQETMLSARTFAWLIGVRDTWQTGSGAWDEACAVSAATSFYGERLLGQPCLTAAQRELGHIMVNKRRLRAAELAEGAWLIEAHGLTFAVFHDSEGITSDAAEHLRLTGAPVDALATYRLVEPGPRIVWSLRSTKPGIDVGAIAKQLGGGGHVRAAGFSATDARLEAVVRDTLRGLS